MNTNEEHFFLIFTIIYIKPKKNRENRANEPSEYNRTVKRLTLEMHLCVIVVEHFGVPLSRLLAINFLIKATQKKRQAFPDEKSLRATEYQLRVSIAFEEMFVANHF